MVEQEIEALKRYSMWKNHFESEPQGKATSAQFAYLKTGNYDGCSGCNGCEGGCSGSE